MILRELTERVGQAAGASIPLRCKQVPVLCDLHLTADGEFVGFGPKKENGVTEWGPFIEPTMSGKPGLGLHKLEHLIGYCYPRPKTTAEVKQALTAESKHVYTRTFLLECENYVLSPGLQALNRFLDAMENDPAIAEKVKNEIARENIATRQQIAVRVDDKRWFQEKIITDFWRETGFDLSDSWPKQSAKNAGSAAGQPPKVSSAAVKISDDVGECLVCGAVGALARLMPVGLEGFGQDKPKLASFNRAAYASRGLSQTYNAPLCNSCAELAPKGWNMLWAQSDSRFMIGDHRYVVWGEPLKFIPNGRPPDPADWRKLIEAPWKRKEKLTAPKYLNVLGLGAHKATAYVVMFLKKDHDEAAEAALRWWRWQDLLGEKQDHCYALTDLVVSLWPRAQRSEFRRVKKSLSKQDASLSRELFLASLGEGQIPSRVLPRLVNRLATEPENIFAALDRLVFLNICLSLTHYSRTGKENIILAEISESNRNAYNTGRIFNLIVYAQDEAIGRETGKTIAASNCHLASSRPVMIMPRLITRAQKIYLPKLKSDPKRVDIFIESEFARLLPTTTFAAMHTPEQMGWFWKGYYTREKKENAE